jgi:TRAP-type C4-dicarboxylate transport system permease small subunit
MHVLLIIFGLLLIVFGGGCTLIVGGVTISDPSSATSDLATILPLWLVLGLLPLAAGIWLFRAGLRIDREKRQSARIPPPAGSGEG